MRTGRCRESHSQIRTVLPVYRYLTRFCVEPMGRKEIFHNFLLLVEIDGHFTHDFVTYVY
jgi:hypothetical protein